MYTRFLFVEKFPIYTHHYCIPTRIFRVRYLTLTKGNATFVFFTFPG